MNTDSTSLTHLRERIDAIDNELLQLLIARSEQVKQIYALKQERGLDVHDPLREQQILERLLNSARQFRADPDYIRDVFTQIIGRRTLEIPSEAVDSNIYAG